MKGRRILAVILIFCMAAGLIVCPAGTGKMQAAVSGNFSYEELMDGTISITNYSGAEKIVSIPETLDGKRVTVIGSRAFYNSDIEEVSFPSSITVLESSAFYLCKNLIKVTMPEKGMLHIGNDAFYECKNLEEITLSSELQTIGEYAFQGCSKLKEIDLPSTVTDIGMYAFVFCSQLRSVTIPAAVPEIKEHTFMGCSSLAEVTFLNEPESIGGWAFWGCTRLTELRIPDSVTSIGKFTFEECKNLTKLTLPAELTSIEEGAFETCISLTEISIPKGVTSIAKGLFKECTSLIEISIPDGVTSIGERAFSECTGLEGIHIPVSVTEVGDCAFYQCSSLTDVYYSGIKTQWDRVNISTKGTGTGDDADMNANQTFIDAVIHFGDGTVWNGPQEGYYEYENISDDTIEITKYKGCETAVKIPEELDGKRVVKIGAEAFISDSIEEITIPSGVIGLDARSFVECPNLTAIYVDAANECFVSEDGVLFNREKTELVRCPEAKSGSYTVPSDTSSIRDYAFSGCRNLTEIQIPAQVEEIGSSALRGCSGITSLILPESIKMIRSYAFISCTNLEKINIPQSVSEIDTGVFMDCRSLTEIELPEGLSKIGLYAFYRCENLKSIVIPQSVKKIHYFAFSVMQYISSLEDVYYGGDQELWEQIEVFGDLHETEQSIAEKLNIHAVIHFKENAPLPPSEEVTLPAAADARHELERLKSGDSFSLKQDFQHYLSNEQIDIVESCLYIWLAEINYAYRYSGSASMKERIMKKAGIDPQGDFASGMEQAVTHICVETKYGSKTFEITLDLGKPDDNGNLYPSYGAMHYEILEKESIPSDLPKSGQIGRESYADLGTFAECVRKASEDSLHGTYQWETLDDEMTAGVLVDKTVTEIIGNKNGSFSDTVFTIYAKPLFTYSKKVTIACPVDVHVYSMDGKEAGSIVGNKPDGGNANVRLDVNGDTKTVYLAGNDYYLNLRGTDTGTMRYEVEEIANEEVRRNVQFLELQLEKDMQYEGYVFRPLNIDRDLYALRTVGGSEQKVFHADKDTYQALFRRIQRLSLSQGQTSLDRDKTVQLQASLFPLDASNLNLRWTTDSESVAKVDGSGLVTAVGAGRATVTVSTKDGSFLRQFCVIDVAEKIDIPDGNSGGSSSGGSSGWSGGGNVPSVEQEKTPVVVKLHYILQFNANGGTSLSRRTMTLLADDSPGIMPKVKRKDYIFDGWYTQQNGGEQVSGDKPLKEAATLYARWTKATAPAKVAVPTLKSVKKGQIQVILKNVTGAAGYQIEYSANKKFTLTKTKDAGASAKKKTISGLKAGQKYYVRIRAYRLDSTKNKIYGAYSSVRGIRV